MYGIDQNTQGESTGFTGIQENFELAAIRYGVVGKKAEATAKGLMFDFKRGDKFTITHTEFPIDEDRAKQYKKQIKDKTTELMREETPQEAVARAYDEQARRIKHIMSKFVPEETIVFKAATFEEYANSVIRIVGDSYKGIKLRLKLIYNAKNLLSLPKYPKFIELMSVSPTQLEVTEYDKKFLKKAVADSPTGGTAPKGDDSFA